MSNLTNFTGLTNQALQSALVPFLTEHAPLLTESLLQGTASWRCEGLKLVIRFRPAGHWSRDLMLLDLALKREQTSAAKVFLDLLAEAETLKPLLSTTTSSHRRGGWAEAAAASVEPKVEGLSLWIQTWFSTKKGKTSEGLELTFTAAEPDDKEASEEAEGAPVWGT